jgi:drug/metabolite transporter (DMT)-like permease
MIGLPLLVAAALAEATGALYTPCLPHPGDLLVTASVQMLVAGVLLTAAAPLLREPSPEPVVGKVPPIIKVPPITFDRSVRCWPMRRWSGCWPTLPAWLATTYTYVNPAVALLLGWLVLEESLTWTTFLGSALVIVSVVLVAAPERVKSLGQGMRPARSSGVGSPALARRSEQTNRHR